MKKLITIILLIFCSTLINAQWETIHQDSTQIEVLDLCFINKDTGFVCGQISHGVGFVLRTYDGGETWENTTSSVSVCYSIDFVNDSIGYTGGQDGVLYKTTDGGVTWEYVSYTYLTYDYEDLEFINDTIGFVKEYGGRIYKTIDGGETWDYTSFYIASGFYERKFNSINFYTDSIGFVVGFRKIAKTIDQGENWEVGIIDSTKNYRALSVLDENEWFAVGNDGVISHTTDGGLNWTTDSLCDQDLRDIDFINDSIGFIVGGGDGYLEDSVGIVIKTTDRGVSWEIIAISENRLNSFQFIDSVAYATGNYGNIFKNANYSNLIEIEELIIDHREILVFPNPANNFIKLSNCSEIEKIEIYNINGIKCKEIRNPDSEFDVSDLKDGMYLVKIYTDKGIVSEKLIIQGV